MKPTNRIKQYRLYAIRNQVTQLHEDLKAGYVIEGEGLVDVVNAMLNLLHDVIQTAEKRNVTVDGEKVG